MAEPYVRPTRYAVNLLPDTVAPDAHVFEITVKWRGGDRWAVLRHGRCLGADGEWDHELRPSEREDDWIATHLFDLDTAIRLAKEAAPNVTVNGRTAAEALQRLVESGRLAHIGGKANAEDCPACHGTNPPYPFICPGPPAEVVHGCPPDGSGLTPCCGRTPFELPRSDRISSEAPTTCRGAR